MNRKKESTKKQKQDASNDNDDELSDDDRELTDASGTGDSGDSDSLDDSDSSELSTDDSRSQSEDTDDLESISDFDESTLFPNKEFIDKLRETGVIKSDRVHKNMLDADDKFRKYRMLYHVTSLPDGYSARMKDLHMHALILERLDNNLKSGGHAMDLGTESDFFSTCMATMMYPNGVMFESDGSFGCNIRCFSETSYRKKRAVKFKREGFGYYQDDWTEGHSDLAPYDAIHVSFAAPQVPNKLIQQLKPGGRLLMPVGPQGGPYILTQVDKKENGSIEETELMAVTFASSTYQLGLGPSAATSTNQTGVEFNHAEFIRFLYENKYFNHDSYKRVYKAICTVDIKYFPKAGSLSVGKQKERLIKTIDELTHIHIPFSYGEKMSRGLIVGLGTGYLTACWARLANQGKIYAIDIDEQVVRQVENNIKKGHPELLQNITFLVGDGMKGCKTFAPYNYIYVNGAYKSITKGFSTQLEKDGVLKMVTAADSDDEDGTGPQMAIEFTCEIDDDGQKDGRINELYQLDSPFPYMKKTKDALRVWKEQSVATPKPVALKSRAAQWKQAVNEFIAKINQKKDEETGPAPEKKRKTDSIGNNCEPGEKQPLFSMIPPQPDKMPGDARRRSVYNKDLFAQPLTSGKVCTPETIKQANEAEINRLRKWLIRELSYLLKDNFRKILKVQQKVIILLQRYDLQSHHFLDLLRPYLRLNTRRFIHELYIFANCSFDMKTYDKKVRYVDEPLFKVGQSSNKLGKPLTSC